MLNNSSNSCVITKFIYKIACITLICLSNIDAEGSNNQEIFDNGGNKVNVKNNYLNLYDDYETQLYSLAGSEENDKNLHQDNDYAEENLENKNPVFNNSLFSVLSKGQSAIYFILNKGYNCFSFIYFILNKGYNCFSFVKTKLYNFCSTLLDIFLPHDYFPDSIYDCLLGYMPINVVLFYCLYPQDYDPKALLREVGFVSTLHYYFSRYYYRKD